MGVCEGMTAVDKVSGIVVIHQIVVSRVAVRLNGRSQRGQIRHDLVDTRLRQVGAVDVAAAAIYSNGNAVVTKSTVAVLNPEIIGSRLRVWILNFLHGATCPSQLVLGRNEGVAILVA